ncbi:hypothetical protein V493_07889, partial [Pseudogymnoascus sp. VKM F-4281 (FW-2241)]
MYDATKGNQVAQIASAAAGSANTPMRNSPYVKGGSESSGPSCQASRSPGRLSSLTGKPWPPYPATLTKSGGHFVYDPTHACGATRHVDIDGVGLALQDPIALQCTVLLAGTHYFWNRGSYLVFSETYYLYKVATIQTVNAALVDVGAWRR